MIHRVVMLAAMSGVAALSACEEGVEGEMRRHAAAAESAQADLSREGVAFLAENARKDGWETTASGLQYKIVTDIPGDGPTPSPESQVLVNYEGTLIDGTVFDSSFERGQPAEFRVDQVIAGWTEALQLMQAGEEFELAIPAALAYGEDGQGEIGPNQVLKFRVQLLAFQQDGQVVTSPAFESMMAGAAPPPAKK
jgi:FKBP-type peptidyl-prolyl cis-trans isomerase FklB